MTCYGLSVVSLRQGDVPLAIPVLARAMGLCQDWHIPLFVPLLTAALGLAYAQDGRVAAGLALLEHGVEQLAARGKPRRLAPSIAGLSKAYLLADRMEDARQHAVQALDLAHQYQRRGTQAWALWLLGESMARQASPEVEPVAGHYRQALALPKELRMRPLQAHCHRGLGTLYATTSLLEPARTEFSTAYGDVPCHGHDVLAAADGGGAGAAGRAMIMRRGIRRRRVAYAMMQAACTRR